MRTEYQDEYDDDGRPAKSWQWEEGRWVAFPARDPVVHRQLEMRDAAEFCPRWKPAGAPDGDDMDAVKAAKALQLETGLRVRALRIEVLFDSKDDGGPSDQADLPPAGMLDLWLEKTVRDLVK